MYEPKNRQLVPKVIKETTTAKQENVTYPISNNKMNNSTTVGIQVSESNIPRKDAANYYSTSVDKTFNKTHSTIGIQVSENATPIKKSILKTPQKSHQNRPSTAPIIHSKVKRSEKKSLDDSYVLSERRKILDENHIERSNDMKYYSSILNTYAGKESSLYERVPFIQRKKKVMHRDDHVKLEMTRVSAEELSGSVLDLQNEPAFTKKKISCYPKNHNILRTHTIEEIENDVEKNVEENSDPISEVCEEEFDDDKYNYLKSLKNYQYYKSKSLPNSYRTSYNDDFDALTRSVSSPIVLAERRVGSRSNMSDIFDQCMSDVRYTKGSESLFRKEYDKRRYETEYDQSFRKKSSLEYIPKKRCEVLSANEDDFFDYYDQVLQNRQVAYKPILRSFLDQQLRNQDKCSEGHNIENRSKRIYRNEETLRRTKHYDPLQYSDR